MMTGNETQLWQKGVTPPGYLKVDPDVLTIVRAFMAELANQAPKADVVPSLSWSYRLENREDLKEKSKWGEPFVRIGAVDRKDVSPEEISRQDDLELIIQIPYDVCSKAKERRICCKPGFEHRVELR